MTILKKSLRTGWEATDSVPMNGGRVLQVTTSKRSSGRVSTTATSVIPLPATTSNGFSGFSFVIFQDFNKCLSTVKVSATEKNIGAQHAAQMANIAAVVAQANAHQAAL